MFLVFGFSSMRRLIYVVSKIRLYYYNLYNAYVYTHNNRVSYSRSGCVSECDVGPPQTDRQNLSTVFDFNAFILISLSLYIIIFNSIILYIVYVSVPIYTTTGVPYSTARTKKPAASEGRESRFKNNII